MVVLIGGEKGGTGKTTMATSIAALRAGEGRDVLLVDTDKQGSASDWAAVRSEVEDVPRVPCVQVFGEQVANQVGDLAGRYDDVVVDAGGRDSVELRSAMVAADRLFVPVQASQFDVWTLERMEELLGQVGAINPQLHAQVFVNRASPHPQVREAEKAEEIFEDLQQLSFSDVVIHDRIAFRRAVSNGLAVTEADSVDGKACGEVRALYDVVFEEIDPSYAQETKS
jgi:chromosome partitioning protein